MTSALDSTHTVVVKSENRGIRVVIGLLALVLLAKWWWTGSVLFALESVMPPEDGSEIEFKSVTGALLPIFIDLLWFIGSVVVFAATNLWAVLWDLAAGVFETFRYYSARRAAVDAAKQAATEAGSDAASTNAGAIASTAAVDAASKSADPALRRVVDLDKVADALVDHDAKLTGIARRADDTTNKFAELDATVGTLLTRVGDIETTLADLTKPAPAATKTTRARSRRKTPAKAS